MLNSESSLHMYIIHVAQSWISEFIPKGMFDHSEEPVAMIMIPIYPPLTTLRDNT